MLFRSVRVQVGGHVGGAIAAPLLPEAEIWQALVTGVRDYLGKNGFPGAIIGLSGGIDSSAVVGAMQAESTKQVKTFTIGFNEQGFDEAVFAKKVAAHLGCEHTELYVSPKDSLDLIPQLPQIYDEPFADSSQMPTVLVSRLARQRVTVSLSGDGGDELFCGYRRSWLGRRIWDALSLVPRPLRRSMGHGINKISSTTWNSLGIPGERAHTIGELMGSGGIDQFSNNLVAFWKESDFPLATTFALPTLTPTGLKRNAGSSLATAEHLMLNDALHYLPDDLLVKVDRASMSVSLECRAPFLDHRIVEFAWRLPFHMKYRDRSSKWLLRQLVYRYVPRELIDRPKSGFSVPLGAWLAGPLKDWASELLAPERIKRDGLLDVRPITSKWQEHLRGRGKSQHYLWNILMFQGWLQSNSGAGSRA